jgi:glycosyltransferase involved in cell wall biosynthesis
MPDERIRVLRVIARLNVGGPALHATLLTEQLDPARYASTLVAGTEGEDEGDFLALRGRPLSTIVRVPELGREIRTAQDVRALGRLVRLIRLHRPHIVHTHTAKAGAVGRVAAWLCRVPVVVHTYHGHVFEGYFSPAVTRAYVRIERWLARRSSVLVAVTDRVRRDVLALGIGTPDRVVVVPPGLELDGLAGAERHRGELRRELGLADAVPLVGIVARLVPIKAHETFLRAAVRVSDAVPDAHFAIAGGGERREELEGMVRSLGLAARTHFLGWRADLARVYADLDVVALTSRNEGSPIALIEAMAAARPVVSTRAGGVADVVADGETGLLAEVDDHDGLAAAVVRVLQDQELARRLGASGRRHALRSYGSGRLLADIDSLYTRLLAGPSAASAGASRPR